MTISLKALIANSQATFFRDNPFEGSCTDTGCRFQATLLQIPCNAIMSMLNSERWLSMRRSALLHWKWCEYCRCLL